jgi:hypothetical protein
MPGTDGPESDLYLPVQSWMRRHFSCWETRINTGPKVGRIDVVGIRDVGGDLSARSEVIAIEVKAGRQPFATSAGQALGYSVMADRCYLADYRPGRNSFSEDEKLIAARLGVGLIAIRDGGRMTEVSTAPPHEPIEELRLQVIEKLGLSVCSVCGTVFRRSEASGPTDNRLVARATSRPGALRRAVAEEKGFVWWLHDSAGERDRSGRDGTAWRRYLCSDCAWHLFRDFADD